MLGNFVSDLLKTALVDLVLKRPVQIRVTRDEHGRMDMQMSLTPSGDRGQPSPWPSYMPMYSPQLMQPGYMMPGLVAQPWAPPATPQQLPPPDPAVAAMQAQAQNVVAALPKNWRS